MSYTSGYSSLHTIGVSIVVEDIFDNSKDDNSGCANSNGLYALDKDDGD